MQKSFQTIEWSAIMIYDTFDVYFSIRNNSAKYL